MSEPIEPFENGDSDRNAKGQFRPGWRGGPGSPQAKHARQLRERLNDALHKICSPDRLLVAVDACMRLAEAGDIAALKLLIERIAGPAVNTEIIERLEEIENRLAEAEQSHG